jgi:hypothetical protein
MTTPKRAIFRVADGATLWPSRGNLTRENSLADRPLGGAEPGKLAKQISQYGKSIDGLPSPLVVSGKNGELQLVDGVTRCTRVGKLCPGQPITVEVIETRPKLDLSRFPTVGDKLP